MATRKQTFSRNIKDELCQVRCDRDCCKRAEIAATVLSAGRQVPDGIHLHFTHAGSAQRFARLAEQILQIRLQRSAGRERVSFLISDQAAIGVVVEDIRSRLGTDLVNKTQAEPCLDDCCRQAALRALFLCGGRVSEPTAAYHLEISVHHPAAAKLASSLLSSYDIHAGILDRQSLKIVYLKEGQQIADFLLLTGAHQSLLQFESLRVEKEMRNTVNRVVNCDSANTQRVANTAVRQTELIRRLSENNLLSLLEPRLVETAKIRLENPDLSLKELGEIMQPPLGKSGINHRLQQIEKRAAELLKDKEI